MSPPLRDKRNQPFLWNNLANGNISTVATDHAPFDFKGQKEMGRGDFTKIPNGIPSLEDRINVLFTTGVKTGQIGFEPIRRLRFHAGGEIVRPVSAQGHDRVGSDADLVVYDPNYKGTISAKNAADGGGLQSV